MDREITLRDYGRVLWSGRWLILATTLGAALIGLLLTFANPTDYTARAKVSLGQATTASGVIAATPLTSIATSEELLRSDDVVEGVARKLGISASRVRRDVTIDVPRPPAGSGANQPPVANISFEDGNRRIAEEGVDAYAQAVLVKVGRSYLRVKRVLDSRLVRAQQQVARLQRDIETFGRQLRAASGQDRLTLQILLSNAQTQLATSQANVDTNSLQIAKAEQIEAPSIVSRSSSASSSGSAPQRLRTVLFAAIIGFIVGVIATFVWKGGPAGRAAAA